MHEKNPQTTQHKNTEKKQGLFTEGVKDNLIKGVYIVVFSCILYVLWNIMIVIAIIQFALNLVLGKSNINLLTLAKNLNLYFNQIFGYITYNSDQKPYPFSPWPGENLIHKGSNKPE